MGRATWYDKYKAEEQAWMVLKDQYAEVAQALGIKCDSWFGDPLCSHKEVVARAAYLNSLESDRAAA